MHGDEVRSIYFRRLPLPRNLRADLIRYSEANDSIIEGSSVNRVSIVESGDIQEDVLKCYSEDVLLPAFQLYRVLVSAFRQKLRPPTYAGAIERKLWGWDRKPATDADVAHVLVYSGMEEVVKIMSKATYSARLQALGVAILRINGRSLPVGSRWMEGRANPTFIQDLGITPISNISFMQTDGNVRLTALYSPWLRVLLAREETTGSTETASPDSQPFISSPFSYIEDLLKDHTTEATAVGSISVDLFSARANAPDEAADHVDDIAAGPANAVHGYLSQHQSSTFPTQYG